MKKGLTEMVFILDRSGSMHGLENDTVGGFNSMIEKQKAEEGEALVFTVLFNSESFVLHDRVPIASVPPMTEKQYTASGNTALMDAVADAIAHIGNVHKYARDEDVPERTVFVITTDGMENASRRHTHRDVRNLIERQKAKYGWEFLFLGANIDAEGVAEEIGIERKNAVRYHNDPIGMQCNYAAVGEAMSSVRKHGAVSEDWAKEIKRDYKSRKK
ncbi:MAG: vWA domain-containing protein [Christensenellales bacterium]|jgi:uncharacterized protein YegL